MQPVRWASWMVTVLLALGGVHSAADVTSDEAAAILIWPDVVAFVEDDFAVDTVIQVTNTSPDPVVMKCFYENANPHCDNTGEVCFFDSDDCRVNGFIGNCIPGWNEVDFRVVLTPYQPLGWLASIGMAGFAFQQPFPLLPPPLRYGFFPIDGFFFTGISGATNVGSLIPPVAEEPFFGILKCIAVDEAYNPVGRNVLKGESSSIERFELEDNWCAPTAEEGGGAGCTAKIRKAINVGKHNAIGIKAIPDAVNGDQVLCLCGEPNEICPDGPEYNGCPNFLILDHFFDFAYNPVFPPDVESEITTVLHLVPCTQDLLRQQPGGAVVQYLVYNEFEQRFSTSRAMLCKQTTDLSLIDTTQPRRSIWSAGVAGTLTGQTRMNPIGSGVLGMAREFDFGAINGPFAEFNIHLQGDRVEPDVIILP